jgi:hypothetical protein
MTSALIMTASAAHKDYATKALRRLSVLASEAKIVIELALCHAAVVVGAYHASDGRRGGARPNDIAGHLAAAVSEEMRMRHDWLETDIAIYLTAAVANHELREGEFAPGIVLSVNGGARILAHKLFLLRDALPPSATDARDAEFLLTKISVSTPGQIKYIYARAYAEIPMSPAAEELIQRAFHGRVLVKV